MLSVPASVPTASSLGLRSSIPGRDVKRSKTDGDSRSNRHTDDHFDPENIFEDIEILPRDYALDSDLDRLLSTLPRRNVNQRALEQECNYQKKRFGNMIVVFPRCLHRGFGIMGPHWYVVYIFQ